MNQIRLAPKLALMLLIFATAIIVALGLFSFNSGRSALHDVTVAHLSSNTIEKQGQLDHFIITARDDISNLANIPTVQGIVKALAGATTPAREREDLRRGLQDLFAPWYGPDREFHSIMVLDADTGMVLAASRQQDLERFKEDRLYFRQGKKAPFVQGP